MQQIAIETLAQVTGGASKSSEITASLSAVASGINDLKYANNSSSNNSSSSNLLLPIMLMSMNKRQNSAVVSTPGATVVTQG